MDIKKKIMAARNKWSLCLTAGDQVSVKQSEVKES
jgi:hypothetical protein